MSFLVRVPATSANLGPGFDCLGLALDLWNEVEVSTESDGLQIAIDGEGALTLPKDKTNAIYQAMERYAHQHGKVLPKNLCLRCQNNIPLGSGLGSSSAAAVAGILAASALLEIPEDKEDQLKCATEIEGHPDNVAPCLFGGLVVSLIDGSKVISRKISILPFPLVIVTPDFNFPTSQARAALPAKIPHQDAVFNLSRVVFLVEALRNGDFHLLEIATQDQLHQPYRLPLIPGAIAAISAAKVAGAVSVVLSGAGPSLLAILRRQSDDRAVAPTMIDAFKQAGLSARIFTPQIIDGGAVVSKI